MSRTQTSLTLIVLSLVSLVAVGMPIIVVGEKTPVSP
jgi:hypothetical protein